jgi:transcription termination factor NusB
VRHVAFRAKTYENRKEEKKLQVSGDQSEFNKLVKGDADTKEAFDKAISDALKK